MPSIIKVDQIQSDTGAVNVSSNLQFSSGFTMLSPTIATPTFTGQATIPTINLTGGQIVFPATQNTSSNANTLDDYEEGTFSISYSGGGSSPTIVSQSNSYVKVGKMVTVSISAQINLGSTSTTLGTLSGFPFAFATNYATAISREWYSTGKSTQIIGQIGGTDAGLSFYDNTTSLTGVTFLGIGVTFSYVTTS